MKILEVADRTPDLINQLLEVWEKSVRATHLFLSDMTPTTFTYRFKLILKKNGLPQELNVHSLRHTAASLMIAGGTDVATVAGILGHSQPSTTLDIYTHAFDKNKKAASACLQGMLEI